MKIIDKIMNSSEEMAVIKRHPFITFGLLIAALCFGTSLWIRGWNDIPGWYGYNMGPFIILILSATVFDLGLILVNEIDLSPPVTPKLDVSPIEICSGGYA